MYSILIPAYNEEKRIQSTISALLQQNYNNIIVINDGSTDGTKRIAENLSVKVIDTPGNLGKGKALEYGIKYAKEDIIVFLDADVGDTSVEIRKLIEPIEKDIADVTIAKFPQAKKKGGFGLVKALARYGIKATTGKSVYSVLSGQRAMKREVLKNILPFSGGYGLEVGMTIDILRNNYRVAEIDVNMTHNETTRDIKSILHRGRQFIDIFFTLFKKAFIK